MQPILETANLTMRTRSLSNMSSCISNYFMDNFKPIKQNNFFFAITKEAKIQGDLFQYVTLENLISQKLALVAGQNWFLRIGKISNFVALVVLPDHFYVTIKI